MDSVVTNVKELAAGTDANGVVITGSCTQQGPAIITGGNGMPFMASPAGYPVPRGIAVHMP